MDRRTSSPPVAPTGVLPRSLRFVVWGNAVLLGGASLDEAASGIAGDDVRHRVRLAGEELAVTVALGRLRARGVPGLRLVLPVPGDPEGLAGPVELVEEAVARGEAVVTAGLPNALLLLPSVEPMGSRGHAVRWDAYDVDAPVGSPPSLAEAERELRVALREATELLARLDVARWDESAVAEIRRVQQGDAGPVLPAGYPSRAHRVAAQAELVLTIARVARGSAGAASTAREQRTRDEALAPLDRAGRRAVVAAAGCLLEPRDSVR